MNPHAQQDIASHPIQLKRLGVVMEPERGNPMEVGGVLNPASARGRDGQLYLFPRLVAQGNDSRIGIVRVRSMRRAIRWASSGWARGGGGGTPPS